MARISNLILKTQVNWWWLVARAIDQSRRSFRGSFSERVMQDLVSCSNSQLLFFIFPAFNFLLPRVVVSFSRLVCFQFTTVLPRLFLSFSSSTCFISSSLLRSLALFLFLLVATLLRALFLLSSRSRSILRYTTGFVVFVLLLFFVTRDLRRCRRRRRLPRVQPRE